MKETTKEDSLRGYNTAIESLRKSNSDEAMELLRKSFSMETKERTKENSLRGYNESIEFLRKSLFMEMQDPQEKEKTLPELLNELRELLYA